MQTDWRALLADPAAVVYAAAARAWKPRPPMDLNRWAAENVVFVEGESDRPGPWRGDLYPLFRPILEAFSLDHPAREITFTGSSQIGKTTLMGVVVGGIMDLAPRNIAVILETLDQARSWRTKKFDQYRSQWPAMERLFGRPRTSGGKTTDSALELQARGLPFYLHAGGARSPSGLRSFTAPIVLRDEFAAWEETEDGDPDQMTADRALAFLTGAKIGNFGTPRREGACRITRRYLAGTQTRLAMACPHCGHRHTLEWENVEVDEADPDASYLICPGSGCVITEADRIRMLRTAEPEEQNPGGDHPSFRLWTLELYSHNIGFLAREYLKAKGDPLREEAFWNQKLGLPYHVEIDTPDWQALKRRADEAQDGYDIGIIPPGHPILTAGVDVQGDRLEVHIRAYGGERRQATVSYEVIPHFIDTPEAFAALDAVLRRKWRHAGGQDRAIDMLAIDFNFATPLVKAWAKRHPANRVKIVQGVSSTQAWMFTQARLDQKTDGAFWRRSSRGYRLNADRAKELLYQDLKVEDPQARRYCRFPRGLPEEFFQQLCSEKKVRRNDRSGLATYRWELVSPGIRNEVLDTANYATLAAMLCGWHRLTPDDWARLEHERESPPPDGGQQDLFARPEVERVSPSTPPAPQPDKPEPPPVQQAAPAPTPARPQRRAVRWLDGTIGH